MKFGASIGEHPHFLLLIEPFLDLLSHMDKHLLNIFTSLGTSLIKPESHLLRKGCAFCRRDLPFQDVSLVADQHLHDIVAGVQFDLFDPVLYVLEGLTFIDGVGEDDAHGAAVVGLRDGLELLLASRVPDLQPYLLLADGDELGLEVDADGGEVRGHEVVFAELEQHVRLAHSAVADY